MQEILPGVYLDKSKIKLSFITNILKNKYLVEKVDHGHYYAVICKDKETKALRLVFNWYDNSNLDSQSEFDCNAVITEIKNTLTSSVV